MTTLQIYYGAHLSDSTGNTTAPRAQNANSPNKLRFSGLAAAVNFDAFHLADKLLTQPLQIVIGTVPGGFGSYRDGFELFYRKRRAEAVRGYSTLLRIASPRTLPAD